MNKNVIMRTAQSILHRTAATNDRWDNDRLGETIANTLIANYAKIAEHYGINDEFELTEVFTRDYIRHNGSK